MAGIKPHDWSVLALVPNQKRRVKVHEIKDEMFPHEIEVSFWNPDANGQIQRESRVVNGMPGLSRFSEVVLHQGRMEQFFLDAIRASYPAQESNATSGTAPGSDGETAARRIQVERCVIPTSLEIDESLVDDDSAYPVTVTLRHLSEEEATPTQMLSNLRDGLFRSNLSGDDVQDMLTKSSGSQQADEVVKCKYVVGCDGAHSWTRKTLGKEFEMQGEMTDFIWYDFFFPEWPCAESCDCCKV
jgi:phenol 2-monooxygenase